MELGKKVPLARAGQNTSPHYTSYMKKIVVASAALLPLAAVSSEKSFYPSAGCKLFSFSSGKFAAASPTVIPPGTKVETKPHPKRSDFELFKYDQISYGAISSCFGAASAESAELPLEVESDSPPIAEEVQPSTSGASAKDYRPTVFFRTTINAYDFTDGETDGSTSTNASTGITTTVGKLSLKAGLGFLMGFHVSEPGSVIVGYRQLKATQDGSISNGTTSGTGSIGTAINGKFYTLGYQHELNSSLPIIPYVQGNIVYGKTEETAAITGFNGAFSGINGNAKLSESSFGAHFELGAILPIASHFGITGGLGLTFYSGKKSKVESSTSSAFTNGEEIKGDSGKSHLNLALGAQIQF